MPEGQGEKRFFVISGTTDAKFHCAQASVNDGKCSCGSSCATAQNVSSTFSSSGSDVMRGHSACG